MKIKIIHPCGCLKSITGESNVTDVDDLLGTSKRDIADRLPILMAITCPACGERPNAGIEGIGGFLHQFSAQDWEMG